VSTFDCRVVKIDYTKWRRYGATYMSKIIIFQVYYLQKTSVNLDLNLFINIKIVSLFMYFILM